jgi:hypothetical protein
MERKVVEEKIKRKRNKTVSLSLVICNQIGLFQLVEPIADVPLTDSISLLFFVVVCCFFFSFDLYNLPLILILFSTGKPKPFLVSSKRKSLKTNNPEENHKHNKTIQFRHSTLKTRVNTHLKKIAPTPCLF